MKNPKAEFLLLQADSAPAGDIIEIGATRSDYEHPSDGWTTVHLARWARDNKRTFRSFDKYMDVVERANSVLEREGLTPVVRQDDGEYALHDQSQIALLYLDGSKEPEETLEQFFAAIPGLVPGAVIIVDDVEDFGDWRTYGKATLLVSRLSKLGIRYDIHEIGSNKMLVMRTPQ